MTQELPDYYLLCFKDDLEENFNRIEKYKHKLVFILYYMECTISGFSLFISLRQNGAF